MTAVVLVHGGAHGAWCWSPTLEQLRAPAQTVDLPPREVRQGGPARNEYPALLDHLTIDDFATSVLADLDGNGYDQVVLVGHSMGGLTVAEVARREPARVAHLVFVSCLVPPEGRAAVDAMPPDVAQMTRAAAERSPASETTPLGLSDDVIRFMFCNDMDNDQTRYVADHVGTDTLRPLLEPVTRSGLPSSLPKTYIRLSRDQSLPPDNQDLQISNLRASPGGKVDVVDLDAGHDVMISRPAELAAVLDRIAAA